MMTQFIAACFGTISFSVIFHVHKRYYPLCGLIGGIGWMVYLLTGRYLSVAEASFCATAVVTVCSRTCAIYKKCPVTIFLISGIFPLVPGAGIYWTAYYLITNQTLASNAAGITTIKTAFAIVLGIVFIFELPQTLFQKIVRRIPYHQNQSSDL